MSNVFKSHYSNFSRPILSEFMTDAELNELDRKYNDAKVKRVSDRAKSLNAALQSTS